MVSSLTEKLRFIESVFGAGYLASNGKNFGVRCPFCASKDTSKKKLIIRVEDDLNHCWVCGFKAHTLAPLIRKFGTAAQFATYRELYMPEEARRRFKDITTVEEENKKLTLPGDFKLLTLCSTVDPDVRAAWGYLTSRNVSVRDAWYFKLGISNEQRWKRRIIMPSFDAHGSLNYFVGRSFDANDRRFKYDNPELDKLPIVFNELNVDWKRRLVLCEGPFDAIKCGDNVVPLLGSDLNESSRLFNEILINETPIALALDGDMWRTKMPKIVKKLEEYNVTVDVVDVREWGDPGNMTKKQFKDALQSAMPLTWEGSFTERLEHASQIKLRLTGNTYRHEENRRS